MQALHTFHMPSGLGIAKTFSTNQTLTEVHHPILILPLVVAPEPIQPREGVAGSSSLLDLPGIHSSPGLSAGYGQGTISSTLVTIPEVPYCPSLATH